MHRLVTAVLILIAALPAQDLDPLIVQILRPDDTALSGRGLPILFRGMRPTSFVQLQEWMRVVTAPDEVVNQDLEAPRVAGPSAAFPNGRYPSNRTLIIRCDPSQDVAWVQAVALAAWLLPDGGGLEARIKKSPLLADVRIGLLDGETRDPVRVLRAFRPKAGGAMPWVEDLLLRARNSDPRPANLMPEVTVQLGAFTPTALGSCKDYRLHRTNRDAAAFSFEPRLFPFRLRETLAKLREKDPSTQVRLLADARVPYVLVHEMLQIVKANELTPVFASSLDLPGLGALVRDGTTGVASDKPAPATGAPLADQPDQGPIPREQIAYSLGNALNWLRGHQAPDGRFDADGFPGAGEDGMLSGGAMHDVGVTAMATLALLDAGHLPGQEGPFSKTLDGAISWLVSQQDAEGCLSPRGDHAFVYGHALATEALARALASKKDGPGAESSELKRVTQRALDFIKRAQNPYRAWRYGVRSGDNDASISSWMLSALVAGQAAGLEVERRGLDWALAFIDELTDEETGRTGYARRGEPPSRAVSALESFPPSRSESVTAMAMWCRLALIPEAERLPVMKKGRRLLFETLPRWEAGGSIDMIYWFWGTRTLSLLQAKGVPRPGSGLTFETWRRPLARALLKNQRTEGTHAGGFRPAGAWGESGGAVYSTALLARTLALLR